MQERCSDDESQLVITWSECWTEVVVVDERVCCVDQNQVKIVVLVERVARDRRCRAHLVCVCVGGGGGGGLTQRFLNQICSCQRMSDLRHRGTMT
jgi:hypothetical protein